MNQKTTTHGLIAVAVLIAIVSAHAADPKQVAYFEKHIRPLLAEHCYECHSADANKVKGGLLLDTRQGWMDGGDGGEVIIPGDPGESRLIEAVRYETADMQMPPRYKLTEAQINALERWVQQGAHDPRTGESNVAGKPEIDVDAARSFWSFQPPRPRQAPRVHNASWPANDIDRFILARLESEKLTPSPDADRRTLIRRVTFDLTGLPPTPDEIRDFVNDPDNDERALSAVVDRLLNSPHFGERWGRHWLDVVRYAESMGRTRNWSFPAAWRYRDYVIAAFNDDKPYDQFVKEQLAGDLLPAESPEQRDQLQIATGFLALGSHDLNERNRAKFIMDVVDEQIDVTGRAFLGLTTGCARCHDHKFDPIPTHDYYALAGIFKSTEVRSGYGNRGRGNQRNYFNPDYLVTLASVDAGEDSENTEGQQQRRLERRKENLQKQLAEKNEEIRRIQGTLRQKSRKNRGKPEATGEPTLNPAQARKKVAALKREVKQLQQQLGRAKNSKPIPKNLAMGVVEGKPQDSRIHLRGDTTTLGDTVPRGFLQVLQRKDDPRIPGDKSGRLELASWITQPDHPLTARVMANRIWHHLLGRGLVPTVDNFGATGERPSHPELLDHLAVQFTANGWSVKQLIRQVVLSRTYRMTSAHHNQFDDMDPDNNFLWRMNVRRLEAESIRDALLAASGRLELKPALGSPVMDFAPSDIGNRRFDRAWDKSTQRSVYLPVLRNQLPAIFEVFDFAEPSSVIGRRDVTTVSTQALFMMNNAFVMEQAREAASLIEQRFPSQPNEAVRLAYERLLGRAPSEAESKRALQFINSQHGLSGFCQALLASAEFRYIQ